MDHIKVISYEEYKANQELMTSGDMKMFESIESMKGTDTEQIIATLKGMLPADVNWEGLTALATKKSALGKAHDLALH